jgi:hypothetical protein
MYVAIKPHTNKELGVTPFNKKATPSEYIIKQ